MALIKCRECGKSISSDADACPNCGKPNKNGKGFTGSLADFFLLVIVLCIGYVAWVFIINSSPKSSARNTLSDNNSKSSVFPVGNYKYYRSTYITISPDSTFDVKSDDELLWRCHGKWSFDGDALNMQADADESRRKWLPYIFYNSAKLISNGSESVVWDCMFHTFEWKKLDK